MKFLIPFFSLMLLSSYLSAMENVNNKPEQKPSQQTKQSPYHDLQPIPLKYEEDKKDTPNHIPFGTTWYDEYYKHLTITYSALPKILLNDRFSSEDLAELREEALFNACYLQTMEKLATSCKENLKLDPTTCYSLNSKLAKCKCELQLKKQNK